MRIVVAGSHGLIGGALRPLLTDAGHTVLRLVRGPAGAADEVSWDPDLGRLDPSALDGVHAVVDLAGVNIGERPLTRERRRLVLTSRLRTTGLLARTIALRGEPYPVLLQASATGWYGDRGEDVLTEREPHGTGFISDVVRQWEQAAAPAVDAGARVALLRTGVVLAPHGGALGRLLPLIRVGLGGRLGPGDQFWSWITLPDEVRAIEHLLHADLHGPVNLTAQPARNRDLIEELASQLHRPSALPVPAFALRAGLGEFSSELLGSVRAVPEVLIGSGFRHSHPDVAAAARWIRATSR